MSLPCSHSFDATELAARDGIAAVMGQLTAQGLPKALSGDVELALAEVVNNVVEHGYAGISGGKVHVEGHLDGDWLELRVIDTGRPLPGGHLPAVRPSNLNRPRADLPEGGFGWALIYHLTDALKYDREGAHNTLSMRFRLDKDDDSPAPDGLHRSRTAP